MPGRDRQLVDQPVGAGSVDEAPVGVGDRGGGRHLGAAAVGADVAGGRTPTAAAPVPGSSAIVRPYVVVTTITSRRRPPIEHRCSSIADESTVAVEVHEPARSARGRPRRSRWRPARRRFAARCSQTAPVAVGCGSGTIGVSDRDVVAVDALSSAAAVATDEVVVACFAACPPHARHQAGAHRDDEAPKAPRRQRHEQA